MQLNKIHGEVWTGIVLFCNPITIYWFWSFYSSFFFFQNLIFFACTFFISRGIFSINVEKNNLLQSVGLGLINGYMMALFQRLFAGFLNEGDRILLLEARPLELLIDLFYMSAVMPFFFICVMNLLVVRWVRLRKGVRSRKGN
jgi:hypothetical protein